MAHSVSPTPLGTTAGAEEPSVGALVQSAMADMSTLVRAEIELAKAEVGKSAKKAGIGGGLFGAAAVVAGFSMFFVFIALAEGLTAIGLPRWLSYLLVWVFLLLLAGLLALVGKRLISKIEKPERTLETPLRPAGRAAPRGSWPAAPGRARGERRQGRAARQRVLQALSRR
ncbi:phage holin family protein [Blastococcus sp. TML/C7B]|uniref:phage holin family protein n=1 Tax=Blastococcus sp. TML/C7B TaxID=2798728 RepID=UPI002815ED85|nr:phage holin family protein [Blastococcus sp. TML/C7B]